MGTATDTCRQQALFPVIMDHKESAWCQNYSGSTTKGKCSTRAVLNCKASRLARWLNSVSCHVQTTLEPGGLDAGEDTTVLGNLHVDVVHTMGSEVEDDKFEPLTSM